MPTSYAPLPHPSLIWKGRPQNADVGEGGHQFHKLSNSSGSSRDPPAHHARRVNTLLALTRLMTPEPYTATSYSFSTKKKVTEQVTSGPGCQRVLQAVGARLRGGISKAIDGAGDTNPTAVSAGQRHRSATWSAAILRDGDAAADDAGAGSAGGGAKEPWEVVVSEGAIRPSAGAILRANSTWFDCGRTDADNSGVCTDPRCSACWEGGRTNLENDGISCYQIKHGVPSKVSSGMGRLKGADVKAASTAGANPRDWAVGSGQGEHVEIFTSRKAQMEDLTGDGNVTLATILYFFDHNANRRAGSTDEAGPTVEYVLVYEFVTCGAGRSKKEDSATRHPTYWLQGGVSQRPSVFPADAIRRHVHMYHQCPASSFITGVNPSPAPNACGLRDDDREKGGGKIWKHHYRLAADRPTNGTRDAYMLNEHWQGSFQDGVV